MSLTKVNYVAEKTVISTQNLNNIQDSVIALQANAETGSTLTKVNYVDKETKISAKNLNDIQDAIIALENSSGESSANIQESKSVTITSNGTTTITPDAPYDALAKANVTVDVPKIDYNTIASTWEKHDFDFYDSNDSEGTEISATGTATGLFAVLSENDTTSFIVFTAGNPPAETAPQLAICNCVWSFNAIDNGVLIVAMNDTDFFFRATQYIYIQTT